MQADFRSGRTLPLVLSLLAVVWMGCLGQPEDFDVRSVSISNFSSLGNEETVVGINIGLHNPNGYKVQVEDSRLGLWVGVDSVGVLHFVPGVEIAGHAEETVQVEAVLDSRRFSDVLSRNWFEYLVQGAPVRVEGWVRGKAWGIRKTLSIQHEQRIRVMEWGGHVEPLGFKRSLKDQVRAGGECPLSILGANHDDPSDQVGGLFHGTGCGACGSVGLCCAG